MCISMIRNGRMFSSFDIDYFLFLISVRHIFCQIRSNTLYPLIMTISLKMYFPNIGMDFPMSLNDDWIELLQMYFSHNKEFPINSIPPTSCLVSIIKQTFVTRTILRTSDSMTCFFTNLFFLTMSNVEGVVIMNHFPRSWKQYFWLFWRKKKKEYRILRVIVILVWFGNYHEASRTF